MKFKSLLSGALLIFLSFNTYAQLKLPSILSDNMVVQRNSEIELWGWDYPGQEVIISTDWSDKLYKTTSDMDGKWSVFINTIGAGGPYKIVFKGSSTITFSNVLLGDIWVCSGQSNMEYSINWMGGWDTKQFAKSKADLLKQDYSQLRLFKVKRNASPDPVDECEGTWAEPDLDLVENFSAVAWFFGTDLYKSLNIPIGLVVTSWGGTPAEAWTRKETILNNPDLSYYLPERLEGRREAGRTAYLFNGMINPILKLSIKGAIWYQGEANRNDAYHYRVLFPAMIKDWREAFDQGDFPFYYVQIAPYKYREKLAGVLLKEAQTMTLKVKNTGMVVTGDIGNIDDIHPKNKQEVGRRLALNALALTYGQDYLEYSGPRYKSMSIRNNKTKEIVLEFDFVESGLLAEGGELSHFTIAGTDRQFVDAKAVIEDSKIIVLSPEVPDPKAVRFAFSNTAEPNLYNGAGLPAGPFRTDDWEINTQVVQFKKEEVESKGRYIITLSAMEYGAKIRFTLDGSEPGLDSKLYKKALKLKEGSVLKTRVFINGLGSVNTSEFRLTKD